MLPNTDGTTTQAQTEQPAPSAPSQADPSQEFKITKADWDRVNSLLGRIPDLQGSRDIARQTKEQVAQLDDKVRTLLERAHTLGTEGKSLNEALTQVQTEQTDAEFRAAVLKIAQGMGGGAQPSGTGNAQGVNLTTVLADYKLDPTDPFVAAQLQGKAFTNATDAELFAARVFRDKQLAPNPNSAQSPTMPGSAPAGGMTAQQIEEKSTQLLRLYDNYDKNAPQINVLEKEIAEYWATHKQ